MKQVFIGMIPQENVDDLLKAAREVKISNNVFISEEPIKDEETGETLEGHVTIYTTKPELSKQLWERYEFHVAWNGFDLNNELKGIVK